jgi:uncharacterized membrane protein
VAATAMMAGLFYSFSIAVMPGLKRLPDAEFIAAMQSINKSILNIIFFIAFFGSPLSLIASAYLYYSEPFSTRFIFLLIAVVVYLAGVFVVTVFGNIPLNNALDRFDLRSASQGAISAQRAAFEGPWNKLNTIRTLASSIAIILVVIACLSKHF